MTLAYGSTDCVLQVQHWRKADEQDKLVTLPSFAVPQWNEGGRLVAYWEDVCGY